MRRSLKTPCTLIGAMLASLAVVHWAAGVDAVAPEGDVPPVAPMPVEKPPEKPVVKIVLKAWSPPEAGAVRQNLLAALSEIPNSDAAKAKVETLFVGDESPPPDELLRRVAVCLAEADPRAKALVEGCDARNFPDAATVAWLGQGDLPKFATDNLRLYWGASLARADLVDEAREAFGELQAPEVVDPASLLFFQGVAAHRLLDKERCEATLKSLLEHEDKIAVRYASVAKLMLADIEPLKPDSLDEVSRMMDDVRRRLGLGRAGQKVRDEEDDVVKKLDKMINKLEEQQKKQQQQQQQQQQQRQQQQQQEQQQQSQRPADRDKPFSPEGASDEVDQKDLGKPSSWGNLPPRQRQEALQQISKELPSHYRETVEEYFKRLAQDSGK